MPKVTAYLACGCAILENGSRVHCASCEADLSRPPIPRDFGFQELLERRPKTQAEAMLCQAIAALSTQPQFSTMTPWEIFEYMLPVAWFENISQGWHGDGVILKERP